MFLIIFHIRQEFFKVLVFFITSFIVVALLGFLVYCINPRFKKPNKNSSYECGCEVLTGGFSPIDVDFFVLAILFIIFDVEFLFIFMLSITFKDFYFESVIPLEYWSIALFYFLILLGLVYEILRKSVDFFNDEKSI